MGLLKKIAVALLCLVVFLPISQAPAGLFRRGGHGGSGSSDDNQRVQQGTATGKYAASVRISCTTENGGCWGSGVIVCWGGEIRIVTALHVVEGVKTIKITASNGQDYPATVLATSDWDVAILGVSTEIVGVEPAYLATEDEVQSITTDALESCGFGGRGIFGINTGHLIGYFDKGYNTDEFADWLEIDGAARRGDSGGPIFNSIGHVVGIVRASDFHSTVVGVQAGRLGKVLNETMNTSR